MKVCILILLISLAPRLSAQTTLQSPQVVNVPAECKLLIDSLARVSGYEQYFNSRIKSAIWSASFKRGWTEDEQKVIAEKANFQDFMHSSVYPAYADLNADQLKEAIALIFFLDTKDSYSKLVLTNYQLTHDLQEYIRVLLEGS